MISRVTDHPSGAAGAHDGRAGWAPQGPFDARAGGPRDAVLDGLRAVAVSVVVLGHALLYRFGAAENAADPRLTKILSLVAMTGVWIFFLISGYVITRLLLIERGGQGSVSLARFYMRRVTRIIPPFAVYLATIFVLSRIGYLAVPPLDVFKAGLFLCNVSAQQCHWFAGHSWSLAVEEQFYLVWPLLLSWVPPRRVVPVLVAVSLALIVVAVVREAGYLGNEISFLFIVVGVLMASSPGLQRLVVTRVTLPVWLGAAALLVVVTLGGPDAIKIVLKPVLLAVLVFGAANVAPVAALLKSRPFQLVGACSYSLYLWQQLFFASPAYYFGPLPPLWLLPVVVWLSWRFVEKPGMALGRAWTRRAAAPMPAGTHFS